MAFWFFLAFGLFTVLLACGGGFFFLLRSGGAWTHLLLSSLLLFLGVTLAVMLGSLLVIRIKEKKQTHA